MQWNVIIKGHKLPFLLAMELLAYFQELDILKALVYNRKHGLAAGRTAGLARSKIEWQEE